MDIVLIHAWLNLWTWTQGYRGPTVYLLKKPVYKWACAFQHTLFKGQLNSENVKKSSGLKNNLQQLPWKEYLKDSLISIKITDFKDLHGRYDGR